MKYPIGIQDFEKIRKDNYLYVDKTAFIWRLINSGCYYFLSRPRRFGKSLLLSTIAAYFSGKKELFEGLAIAEKTAEWVEHPVLRLDLSGKEYNEHADLIEQLDWNFKRWEALYGADAPDHSIERRFATIIHQICELKQRKVVILVDEYDKPLLETLGNETLQSKYRSTLRAVYSNLKSCDECIQFAMLTGVTKFSKLSIFSDLNNLKDISMLPQYATLCGITEEELLRCLEEGIENLADSNGMTRGEALAALKARYDGYHFSSNAEGVYNPFSLLNALNDGSLEDYWFETGTPTFLVKMMVQERVNLENLSDIPVQPSKLNALDSLASNPLPILYQSGYLTISHSDDLGCYLRFPNEEVERAFLQELLPNYTGRNDSGALLNSLVRDIRAGKPESFMNRLQALLADIPYEQGRPGEIYFRNLLFTIFRLMGFYCEVEHPVAGGRSDVVIKSDRYIYVLELKVDQSAEDALKQIEEKGYAAPYAADERRLFKLGVNFSTKSKCVDEWRIAEG